MTDPRIKILAKVAAAKIKRISEGREREIQEIYQDFRTKANAISRGASTDDLAGPGADLLPKTEVNES